LNTDTRKALEARGHQLADKPAYMGDAEGVMIDPQTGMRLGASDPRLGGAAVGY
jgi:gamma-glutamyltranspeptidase/glutathione hydrolase